MANKKLRIEEKFKELLKSRILGIWWIICFIFIVSIVSYYVYYRENYQTHLKLFAIILFSIIFFSAFFTLIFYFIRKRKFKKLISTLPPPNLSYLEDLFQSSENWGYKTLGIISKEGINIVLNSSELFSIPKEDIVWIYQKSIKKDKNNQNIPGMTIITKDREEFLIPGYKVTNFLRSLFPAVYLSIEGSLKHKELQNMFSLDFGKMAQTVSPPKETTINSGSTTSHLKTPQEPFKTTKEVKSTEKKQDIKPPRGTKKASNEKEKPHHLRYSIRKFFIRLLLLGLVLGGVALVLGIISVYPSVGKKVLVFNTILGSIYIIFVTVLVVSFLTKLIKRSLVKNFVYLLFVVLLSFGLKNSISTFYDSFLDLREQNTKEDYYTIRGIRYQNKFWLQENSEYMFYISPVNSRRKEDLTQYSIRRTAFENSQLIDDLIANQETQPLPYLYMRQYRNSEIIEEIRIISPSEFEELTKEDSSTGEGTTEESQISEENNAEESTSEEGENTENSTSEESETSDGENSENNTESGTETEVREENV